MNESVFIGIPTHDRRMDIGTTESIMYPRLFGDKPKVQISVALKARSLLANNFNWLWCDALNHDHKFTHFCLLHSDIEIATNGWLIEMLEIMKREEVDVLSVASPIKNSDYYSCGYASKDCSERYKFNRKDLGKLPPTFKTKDVREYTGKPESILIFNTACLMWRINKVDPITNCFKIADDIQKVDGKWFADAVPEDWFFSSTAYFNGISCACTTEIKLNHAGFALWSNEPDRGNQ